MRKWAQLALQVLLARKAILGRLEARALLVLAGAAYFQHDMDEMRRLGEVLESPEALAVLRSPKGGMEAAIRVLDARRGGNSQVFKALTRASDLLDRMPRNEYRGIAEDPVKADLLRDLHQKIETLFEELRIKL